MFLKATLSSALAAAASAASFEYAAHPRAVLAQVGTSSDGSCCCHVMPCLPTCNNMCDTHEPLPPLPPVFEEPLPSEEMNNVVLNLDTIITHIYHELVIEHEIPQLPIIPQPNVSVREAEDEIVQNVITPIVIQFMAHDVQPVLPICTYPDGTSFYLHEPGVNHQSSLPDQNDRMVESLEAYLSELTTTVSETQAAHIETLDAQQIVEDMLIAGPEDDGFYRMIILEEATH